MPPPACSFVTPTLLAGDRSLANVVAHEIAHSWTGGPVRHRVAFVGLLCLGRSAAVLAGRNAHSKRRLLGMHLGCRCKVACLFVSINQGPHPPSPALQAT